MEVLALQLVFMAVIFIATTCIGLTPVLLGRFLSRKFSMRSELKTRLLSDASCFGAGVFLSVCFLGLLPESDQKFHVILQNLADSNEKWEEFAEFPWAFFVVVCGFLVIFTVDKLAHAVQNSKGVVGEDKTSFRNLIPPSIDQRSESNQDGESKELKKSPLNYECHIEACGIFEDSHSNVPSSVIFLVALSVHSVFEGIAVGLQTSQDKIMEYAVAILLHELVMALTFGLEVSKSHSITKRTKVFYVLIFTMSIPVGIALGILLENSPSGNRELISAIFEAFAAGIFIHVIFIEILASEFPHTQIDRHKCRLLPSPVPMTHQGSTSSEICIFIEKVFCICCGLGLLIVITVFLAH